MIATLHRWAGRRLRPDLPSLWEGISAIIYCIHLTEHCLFSNSNGLTPSGASKRLKLEKSYC